MNIESEKKCSSSPSKGLILASLKMGLATFLSRVLGLVREQAMAFYFGASGVTDAFLVAYRIPNLMRDLFAEGAFSSAFVPVFTGKLRENSQGARRLLWTLLICLLAVTGVLSLAMVAAAPALVEVFAPEFSRNPERFQLTVLMVRVMAPFLTLVSLAALFMGALNALKVFFIPALAPAVFNITMIFAIVGAGWVAHWGREGLLGRFDPIVVVALGVCLGGGLQILIQLPILLLKGMGPTFKLDFLDRDVGVVFKKLGPGMLGFAATQVNLVVNTVLATSTVVGAVSWLSFAFRLFQFPVGIMGVSVANSNLVLFSEAWKGGNREQAWDILKQAVYFGCFLLFPAAALLWALSLLAVQIIFERGEFGREDSLNTASALKYYALGLPCYGLYKIFVPVFYAMDREKIPVLTSVTSVVFNILFCVIMVPRYGFEVLAMGMTLSIFLNVSLQGFALRRYLNCPRAIVFNGRVARIFFSSLFCVVAVRIAISWPSLPVSGIGAQVLALAVYGSLGGVTYLAVLAVIGEFALIRKMTKWIIKSFLVRLLVFLPMLSMIEGHYAITVVEDNYDENGL